MKTKDKDIGGQKLTSHKSPPKRSEDNSIPVGSETPEPTNQSYAEDHVMPNPAEKTKKRSIASPKEAAKGGNGESDD